jgi:hypothetical protein
MPFQIVRILKIFEEINYFYSVCSISNMSSWVIEIVQESLVVILRNIEMRLKEGGNI